MPYQLLASSYPFNVPPGVEINTNIGFFPTACIVANYSPYYIYLPDGLSFVPPWTVGAIIPLSHATQARASWTKTPFGDQTIPTPPAGVTYSAQFTFTDDSNLSYAGGTIISNPFGQLKTQFISYVNQAAGINSFFNFPEGSLLKHLEVEGMEDGATGINATGLAEIRFATSTTLVRLGYLHLVPDVVSKIEWDWPDGADFQYITSGYGNFTMQVILSDIVGTNLYHFSVSALYV